MLSRLKMVKSGTSARMVPTMNMVMAALHPPMYRMVMSRKAGGRHWVRINTIPMYTAIRQGWVRTFFSTSFRLSCRAMKYPVPTDHMTSRRGIRNTEA